MLPCESEDAYRKIGDVGSKVLRDAEFRHRTPAIIRPVAEPGSARLGRPNRRCQDRVWTVPAVMRLW